MDKGPIKETMGHRGFSFNMESRDHGGNTVAYYFLSEPVCGKGRRDRTIIPQFSCTVWPESGEFQLAYAVPKSINKLETPKCSSFEDNGHFERICAKFEAAVEALYRAFGEE